MATIAELVIKILGDASDYKRVSEGVGQQAKNLGKTATAAGKKLSLGLTLPIVGLGVVAVKSSSDLEESINAANVVFGEANETILQFGRNAATTVGLANSEFNQLATVTGAFLQNVGFNAKGAADETINLTTRAADMASVFNTDVATALNAIQSGLKGEFNPLEQFGVKINAAAIEAKAFSLGLADAEGNIDDNAKATAALALIYGQTEKLAGDFANTSEGLANATKIAKAELTNAAADIGNQLIPIALQLVAVVRQVVTWFTNLTPQARTIILVVLGIVAVVGPLLLIFGALATAIGAIIPVVTAVIAVLSGPVIVVVLAVIAAVALLAAAWKNNWGGIQEKTAAVVAFIKGILMRFWEGLKAIFAVGFEFIKIIFDAWSAAFRGDWTTFGEKVREVWDKAWALIVSAVQGAWDLIKNIISTLIKNVISFIVDTDWLEVGMNIIKGIASGITSGLTFIADAARNAAAAALDAAKGFLGIGSPSKAFAELGIFSAEGFGKGFSKEMAKFQPGMSVAMAGAAAAPTAGTLSMPAVTGIKPKANVVIPITYAPMFPRDDEETIARQLGPAVRRILHLVGEDG